MRVICLAAVLVLSGCSLNDAELSAAQATLEARLVEKKAIADNLTQYRREGMQLDQHLAEALAQLTPEQRATIGAMKAGAPPEVVADPRPVLPKESALEGSNAARLRRNIAELEQRCAQLDKVIGEVGALRAHRQEVAAKLEAIEKLKATRPP